MYPSIFSMAPLLSDDGLHAKRHLVVEFFKVLGRDSLPDLSGDLFKRFLKSNALTFLIVTSKRIKLASCDTSQIEDNFFAVPDLI